MSSAVATIADCLPCPPWCEDHHGPRHVSGWRTWQEGDSPAIQFQMVRHDEKNTRTGELCYGQTDFTIEVAPSSSAYAADASRAMGFLSCNDLRALAGYVVALAEEADPYGRDGEPLEWRDTGAQP